ncbi:MAG: galactitol-1-phosphate 5-dehydrogenase [Treponema sp.]|jgi:L-iditol 2-dehydrogenase|nr:galactitol-1-phosphate 5-dehydrogenase [Treponema sp.]
MKAVRLYKPGDIRTEDAPVPEIKDDEVLIKVMAVGICGSDIPRALTYGAHVSPLILGHEFSGSIEKAGKAVKGFSTGDRVTVPPLVPCEKCKWCQMGEYSLCEDYNYYGSRCDGAMAEYIAVKEKNLLRLPSQISYEDAATSDPCANGLHAMARSGFKSGESVVIYGAGPIGLFALQYAKKNGASKIIAVDVWPEKLNIAKSLGADVIINAKEADVPEKVKRETGGGVNVAIDFSGVPAAQLSCIHCVSKLGRVVLLGISHKGLELSEKEVDLIMREQLDLRGSWNSFTRPFPGSDWTGSIELMEKGVTAREIISHRLSLDEAPDIFKKIAAGGFFFNKVMFYPWGVEAAQADK